MRLTLSCLTFHTHTEAKRGFQASFVFSSFNRSPINPVKLCTTFSSILTTPYESGKVLTQQKALTLCYSPCRRRQRSALECGASAQTKAEARKDCSKNVTLPLHQESQGSLELLRGRRGPVEEKTDCQFSSKSLTYAGVEATVMPLTVLCVRRWTSYFYCVCLN